MVSWRFMCLIFIAARNWWKIFANWWRNFQRSWNMLKPHEFSSSLTCVDLTWSILMNRLLEGIDIRKKHECVDSALIQFWFSSLFPSHRCEQAGLWFGFLAKTGGVFFHIFCAPEIVADRTVQVLNETTKQMTITMGNPNALPVNYQWSFVEDADFWLKDSGSWCLGILVILGIWVLFKSWWTGGSLPKKLRCWNLLQVDL